MYKSVVMKRKKELGQTDGQFKMDFDPRIIGNKILPDGTRKTGSESLSEDKLEKFINILR